MCYYFAYICDVEDKETRFFSALKSKKAENVLSAEPLLQELLHLYVCICVCVGMKKGFMF